MTRKSRSLSDHSERARSAEAPCFTTTPEPDVKSCRKAALDALSQPKVPLCRPDWAPDDLEDTFCELVQTICKSENVSWETFVDQARAQLPNTPLATAIRIHVTEYFRSRAEWMPVEA